VPKRGCEKEYAFNAGGPNPRIHTQHLRGRHIKACSGSHVREVCAAPGGPCHNRLFVPRYVDFCMGTSRQSAAAQPAETQEP